MSKVCKYIVFLLGDQQYGVEIEQVRSIERLQEVTEIPGMPSFVKGIINLRGVVTPILDLKERLHIVSEDYNDEAKIIIVNVNNFQGGFIVDAATDVIDIDPSTIEPAPDIIGEIDQTFIEGIANLENRILVLLNFELILALGEIKEVKEVLA